MKFIPLITLSINKIRLNIETFYPKGMLAPNCILVPEKLPLQIYVSYAITVFAYCKQNRSHFLSTITPLSLRPQFPLLPLRIHQGGVVPSSSFYMAYTKKYLTTFKSEVQNLLCVCYCPLSRDLSTLNSGVLQTKAESTFFISFKTFRLASRGGGFVNKTEKRRTHYFAASQITAQLTIYF